MLKHSLPQRPDDQARWKIILLEASINQGKEIKFYTRDQKWVFLTANETLTFSLQIKASPTYTICNCVYGVTETNFHGMDPED